MHAGFLCIVPCPGVLIQHSICGQIIQCLMHSPGRAWVCQRCSGECERCVRDWWQCLSPSPSCCLGDMPNPPLYFPQSTMSLSCPFSHSMPFLSFHALYNTVIKNLFHLQAADTALSASSTCRWWDRYSWRWDRCRLEWEDSLCACSRLSNTCTGTQVRKSRPQRT